MRFVIMLALISICSGYSLPGCTDQAALADLEELVESYQFRYQPKLDFFDCVDMGAANWRLLKAAGYDAKLALKRTSYGSHCYAICPLGDGWAGIETERQNLTHRTGVVITDLDMWTVLDSPNQVYALDERGPPVIQGEVLEYVPIAPALPPIFAQ